MSAARRRLLILAGLLLLASAASQAPVFFPAGRSGTAPAMALEAWAAHTGLPEKPRSVLVQTTPPRSAASRPGTPLLQPPTATPTPALPTPEELSSDPVPAPELVPLRLVFPTPESVPGQGWRPPLYPLPWALAPYDHFFFARPIAADQVTWSLPDYSYGGVFVEKFVHTGIDIPVPVGTPALAAGPGKVTWAGYGLYSLKPGDTEDPYGIAVAIRHDFGYKGETLYTIYGHLDRLAVVRGQHVETGDRIGLSGDTGKTTGPHLHFEVRVGKNNFYGSRNPELWLAPPQGWGVLAGWVTNTAGQPLYGQKFTILSKATGQVRKAISYGKGSVNRDPYYRENLVVGDLPAGEYTIQVPYAGALLDYDIRIVPGLVSYFTFQGKNGFKTGLPPLPQPNFIPSFSHP